MLLNSSCHWTGSMRCPRRCYYRDSEWTTFFHMKLPPFQSFCKYLITMWLYLSYNSQQWMQQSRFFCAINVIDIDCPARLFLKFATCSVLKMVHMHACIMAGNCGGASAAELPPLRDSSRLLQPQLQEENELSEQWYDVQQANPRYVALTLLPAAPPLLAPTILFH